MRLATSLAGAAILLCASAALALNPTTNVQDLSVKGASQGIPNPVIINTGGDDIGSATPIVGLPYSDGGNTCSYANNYGPLCGFDGGAGDVVYSYVCAANISVDIATCGSAYDTEIYVFEDSAANQIACNDDFCGLQSTLTVAFTAGHTYYIVVDGYNTSCGDYVLNVTENVPCVVDCPAGALAEGEPACGPDYNDTYNGGCNSVPPAFTTIPCSASGNQTICGTYGGFSYFGSSYRDTDWYQITLAAPTNITWCVAGESGTVVGIIDGRLGCPVSAFYDYTITTPCTPGCVTQLLPAGTWWLFVGTDTFGSATGCGLDYTATLSGYNCGTVAVEPKSWGEIKADYK